MGMDFRNLGVDKVAVVTDANVGKLDVVRVAIEALEREGVGVVGVFEAVGVEPKEGEYGSHSQIYKELRYNY